MIDRINLILKAKNITARQFAEEIGIQPSGMSHIMSGRNRPSLDFVKKVINRYPEIDIKWLTFGDGEMYAPSIVAVPAVSSNASSAATASQSAAAVPTSSTEAVGKSMAALAVAPTAVRTISNAPSRPQASAPVQPDLFSSMDGTLFAESPSTAEATAAMGTERSANLTEASAPSADAYAPVGENMTGAESVASGIVSAVGTSPTASTPAHVAQTVQTTGAQMSPMANTVPANPSSLAGVASTIVASPAVSPAPASDTPMQAPSQIYADRRQQSYVDENRISGLASADVPENQNLKRKKIVKVVVLYNDHSFSEYYPE